MTDAITIALVGIGGYGNSYVSAMLDAPPRGMFRLIGAIDPMPSACRRLDELKALGVAIHPSLATFHASQHADLVILCTPLHLHASQTCDALVHGSPVLCEKPLCVEPAQIVEMSKARDRADKLVAIGYQWSFSAAIQKLKSDILAGDFGAPLRLRSLVLWPRDEVYYRRNRWAGAVRDADGNLILDSPVNNACAHYLHNMLYLLGSSIDRSAEPAKVSAELYRAHPIQNYDTAALRCRTDAGVELMLFASHATASAHGPIFSFEFERARVDFPFGTGRTVIARFADGSIRDYGSPDEQRHRKLWQTLTNIRERTPTICGIEAAGAHTRCAWATQQSVPQPVPFPQSLIRVSGSPGARKTSVEGLDALLPRCYEQFALPSEMGIEWARAGREITIETSVPSAQPA
jgi:predicted dehydrogenase